MCVVGEGKDANAFLSSGLAASLSQSCLLRIGFICGSELLCCFGFYCSSVFCDSCVYFLIYFLSLLHVSLSFFLSSPLFFSLFFSHTHTHTHTYIHTHTHTLELITGVYRYSCVTCPAVATEGARTPVLINTSLQQGGRNYLSSLHLDYNWQGVEHRGGKGR